MSIISLAIHIVFQCFYKGFCFSTTIGLRFNFSLPRLPYRCPYNKPMSAGYVIIISNDEIQQNKALEKEQLNIKDRLQKSASNLILSNKGN